MNKIPRYAIYFFLISLAFFLFLLSFSFIQIYKGVKNTCLEAKKGYEGDCIQALSSLLDDEKKDFRSRNSAVWALGQLADKKALPFLYELEKSLPSQERCNDDNHLCKYEVQKAIKWCERGNMTSWMYRNREEWR